MEVFRTELETVTGWRAAPATASFLGVSFFQYQKAYNKKTTERNYGMFDLGTQIIGTTDWILDDSKPNHPINCLKKTSNVSVPLSVWKGAGAFNSLCSTASLLEGGVVV